MLFDTVEWWFEQRVAKAIDGGKTCQRLAEDGQTFGRMIPMTME